jgi:hypothetical protein
MNITPDKADCLFPVDPDQFPSSQGWTVCHYRYGNILFQQNQTIQGLSLSRYGEYKEQDLLLLRQILKPGSCVVETSANYGEHTLPLAQHVGSEGAIFAFESNSKIYAGLENNIKQNCLTNIRPHKIDLLTEGSLDALYLRQCTLIKTNSNQGNDILNNGRELLLRLRPYLYIKNDHSLSRSRELFELLFSLKYSLWWHPVYYYNKNNFNKQKENIFGDVVSVSVIGVPNEIQFNTNLSAINKSTDYWWRLVAT